MCVHSGEMADGPKDLEEHFVLRIQDELLADKLRRILREQLSLDGFAELSFQGRGLHLQVWNACRYLLQAATVCMHACTRVQITTKMGR